MEKKVISRSLSLAIVLYLTRARAKKFKTVVKTHDEMC